MTNRDMRMGTLLSLRGLTVEACNIGAYIASFCSFAFRKRKDYRKVAFQKAEVKKGG